MIKNDTNKEDALLVKQLSNGNERAFEKLYQKYKNDIYAFSFSLVKSKSNAEEILQDVYLNVWQNKHKINPDLSFKSFIFTCTRNACLNFLKRAVNEQTMKDAIFYKINTSSNSTILDHIINDEYEVLRKKAIKKLPPKRKIIFKMSREEGKSYEAISAELNISISTVKNQMSKALDSIRNFLQVNTDLTFFILLYFIK
ncbi:RNA polymerase sigma-70 factor [Lutibacter sp. A64]|uniref:RNA polymerase sigma-70 factor n=1 Tax=Lutibacter sp. A64 TaxID=2918526 RepID=UPI001F0560B4|nr:RNA polymerase sigma-70 factor [Lutibacter sp. A64]UMB55445.1 RNA polymerase sigma-70 factor [Lutibacter sp. A64]